MNEEFHGSKIAILCGSDLLVYKRDDFEHIPYPGRLDFPGGGREGCETPAECAVRELQEEFDLVLSKSRLIYRRKYEHHESKPTWFFVATVSRAEIDQISFGEEGQYWRLMSIERYLEHPEGIPSLKSRLRDYLEDFGIARV